MTLKHVESPWIFIRFDAFLATEYNEVFSGYQPGEVVQFSRDQHFEDHICPRPHGRRNNPSGLVSTKLNHLTQLITRENFIIPLGLIRLAQKKNQT
jgi:hypothetical protein